MNQSTSSPATARIETTHGPTYCKTALQLAGETRGPSTDLLGMESDLHFSCKLAKSSCVCNLHWDPHYSLIYTVIYTVIYTIQ